MEALEQAVGELHAKMLGNYSRWVRHVNLQRFVHEPGEDNQSQRGSTWQPPRKGRRRSSVASFGGDDGQSLALSALSGDAWDLCGMWGFSSGEEERPGPDVDRRLEGRRGELERESMW